MSWREPELSRAAARNDGVRISARLPHGKGKSLSVYVTIGKATMARLGFDQGAEVQPLVGADDDRGWVAIRRPPADGSARVLMKLGSVGGGKRAGRTASRVQFSSAYLDGVADVTALSAVDAAHRIEPGMLAVRLPEAWVSSFSTSNEAPKIYTAPAEPEPAEMRGSPAVSAPAESAEDYSEKYSSEPAPPDPEQEQVEPAPPLRFGMLPDVNAPNSGLPWEGADPELRRLFAEGLRPEDIAPRLGRTPGSVSTRLYTLGLKGSAAKKGGPAALTTPAPRTPPRAAPMPAEERRPLARRPAGEPAPVEALGHDEALAAPIAFLRDAGIKVAANPVAAGTWFVDGEPMTARQVVGHANSLRVKGGLAPIYSVDSRTDRVMAAGPGGSSLADVGA